MLLSPPSTATSIIARIRYTDQTVLCWFPERDDAFRKKVKSLGLRWCFDTRAWRRELRPEIHGLSVDRAAELAAALINAGFPVDVDDTVARAIQFATWQPEQKCWVMAGTKDGKFHLVWRGQDDNLYARAKMLPEAQWDPGSKAVTVPAMYFEEVIGFAEEHDFRFTRAAQELVEQGRRDYQKVIIPEAPAPKARKRSKKTIRDLTLEKFADIPRHDLRTTTELYPYQVRAVEKIQHLTVGALFMDMGTGKTRCAIELAARRQERIRRVVWFCPVGLKSTVAAEIAKHSSGGAVYVFDDRTDRDNLPPALWYVVGIESMSSSDRVVLAVDKLIDSDTFVIVDESSYIKGHAARRSIRITEISSRSRYRLLLTGTPLTQGVEDLWSQMRFLSKEILGYESFYSFARNHLEFSEKYPDKVIRALDVDRLAERIAPFVYQVTKEECLDLPPKLYDQIYFDLTQEQGEAYLQAKREILQDLYDEDIQSWVIFRLFTALQQIVSGFWSREGEFLRFPHKRLEALQTAIAGIPEGEKVIIWTKWVESLQQISAALPDCAIYYGGLDVRKRDEQLEYFKKEARFLVATQATGGHGLTINEACYHIFYENEFKYSHRIQAEDRSHRNGQTRPVTYIDLVSNSGIDERIQRALSRKEDVVRSFRREVEKVRDLDRLL